MKRIIYLASAITLLFLVSCGPNPEKSRMLCDKGVDYLYCSQFDEAIEYFNKAIECDANNFEAYYFRGCAFSNNYKNDQAIADWEKAIEIKPDYADAYYNIGLIHYDRSDHSMACYYFKMAEKYGRQILEDYLKFCDYY